MKVSIDLEGDVRQDEANTRVHLERAMHSHHVDQVDVYGGVDEHLDEVDDHASFVRRDAAHCAYQFVDKTLDDEFVDNCMIEVKVENDHGEVWVQIGCV